MHQNEHAQELGHPPVVSQLCTVVRSRDCSPAGSASSSSGISFGVRNDRCDEPPPCGWLSESSGSHSAAKPGRKFRRRRAQATPSVRSSSSSSGFRVGRRSESDGGRSPLAHASAWGGSSDEAVVIGRRREVFSGSAARAARELDSKEFQPDVVDETKCRVLLLNFGYGKRQCCGMPIRGSDLCTKHSRRLQWGRVTGAVSQEVLSTFWRTKLKGRPEEQQ